MHSWLMRGLATADTISDDRLKMMLEDARPSLLITTDDQPPRFSDVPNLMLHITPRLPCSAPLQLLATAPHGL